MTSGPPPAPTPPAPSPQAIEQLARRRGLSADNPGVQLHLIASLLRQSETTLTGATIEAIQHGHTDTEIAILLGLG